MDTVNYKEKFEKLIQRIDNLIVNGRIDEKAGKAILKDFKSESEDEQIKNELIDFIKRIDFIPEKSEKLINWIKKQCVDISSFPEEQRKYMEKYVNLDKITLIKLLAEIDENAEEYSVFVDGSEINDCYLTLEEANRLADKYRNMGYTNVAVANVFLKKEEKEENDIKPKFKIEKDKYYVCIRDLFDHYGNEAFIKGETYLSTKDGYLIPSNSNMPYQMDCPDVYFKPWTMNDVQNGDVLALNGKTFIYAHRKQLYSIAVAHCFVDSAGGFHFDGEFGYTEEGNSIHPVTKEQRERLFSKMKEAGYIWDNEKKELKKIEQGSTWDEKIKGLNELEIYILSLVPDRPLDAIKVDAKTIRYIINKEQNPTTWTDKDWSYYDKLESFLDAEDHYSPTESSSAYQKDVHETLLWLKSLRPKHVTWSEEDERILDKIQDHLREFYVDKKGYPYVAEPDSVEMMEYNWLKSLKERMKR